VEAVVMPKTYSQEQRKSAIVKALTGLRVGTPLTVICSEDGMPCDDTIRNWAEEDAELGREIARAREAGFDQIAMDALGIADAVDEDPASRRVRTDVRLKLLAKWDPKRYGDLVKLSGADGQAPVTTSVMIGFVPTDKLLSSDADANPAT
jgi:hypothetical protein